MTTITHQKQTGIFIKKNAAIDYCEKYKIESKGGNMIIEMVAKNKQDTSLFYYL